MSKPDHPARLVVLRTETVESLLQLAWKAKPEIRNKISLTIATALAALVRESANRSVTPAAELPDDPQDPPAPAPELETHPDMAWP